MRNNKEHIVTVKSGRFAGKEFRIENELSKMNGANGTGETNLGKLWYEHGNYAAKNAIEEDGYTFRDAPFYYGKIGALGYIISYKDLPEVPAEL